MGDVPYIFYEDLLLASHVRGLPATSRFAVHLGDIKRGAVPCDEAVYLKVADILKQSPRPLFVIPGDNEWNDCSDPDTAWQHWRKHLLHFDRQFDYDWQVERDARRAENFAFVLQRTLFVGINLVGGRVHDQNEWRRRHAENLAWTQLQLDRHETAITHLVLFGHAQPKAAHDDFFKPLLARLERLRKPVLYLHGDGHTWIHDQPWPCRHVWRIQVDRGGIAPPIQVHISEDPKRPFQVLRRPELQGLPAP